MGICHHEKMSLDELSLHMSHDREQQWCKLVSEAAFYELKTFLVTIGIFKLHYPIFVLNTYLACFLYIYALFPSHLCFKSYCEDFSKIPNFAPRLYHFILF